MKTVDHVALIKTVLKAAVTLKTDKAFNKALDRYKEAITDGMPVSLQVSHLKQLETISQPDWAPEPSLFDLMHTTQPKKNLNIKKERIHALMGVIQKIKLLGNGCDHSNMVLMRAYHGGGFTPTMICPELLCPGCGLNITIRPSGEMIKDKVQTFKFKTTAEQYGFFFTEKFTEKLEAFVKDSANGVVSSSIVGNDPAKVIRNFTAGTGIVLAVQKEDITIVNMGLMLAKSGV